jgi:hypothetical protein
VAVIGGVCPGISPLPATLLASSKISANLARLARDKAAIFAFGEASYRYSAQQNPAPTDIKKL